MLSLTLIGVLVYAFEAHRQNCLMRKSLMQQAEINRPVVLPDPVRPKGGDAEAIIVNFGKTVAMDVVVPGEVIYASSEESAPHDQRCEGNHKTPPKIPYMTAMAPVDAMPGNPVYYPVTWKSAGVAYVGGQTLYAVGCIYYKGLDGTPYFFDICTKQIGDSFQNCDSRDRNQ